MLEREYSHLELLPSGRSKGTLFGQPLKINGCRRIIVPKRFLAPANSYLSVGPSPIILIRFVCSRYLPSNQSHPFETVFHFISALFLKMAGSNAETMSVNFTFLDIVFFLHSFGFSISVFSRLLRVFASHRKDNEDGKVSALITFGVFLRSGLLRVSITNMRRQLNLSSVVDAGNNT